MKPCPCKLKPRRASDNTCAVHFGLPKKTLSLLFPSPPPSHLVSFNRGWGTGRARVGRESFQRIIVEETESRKQCRERWSDPPTVAHQTRCFMQPCPAQIELGGTDQAAPNAQGGQTRSGGLGAVLTLRRVPSLLDESRDLVYGIDNQPIPEPVSDH